MGLLRKLKGRPLEAVKVLVTWGFALLVVSLATPSVRSLALGLPLILIGLAIRVWAAGHLRRNEQLATSGPYAYVRDPLYLGRFFLLCGLAVCANNGLCYLVFALALVVFFLNYMPRKLRKETQRLERHFGKQYSDYHGQVRSLIPHLRPYAGRSPDRWRADVFWRENREQWLVLAVLALVGVMALKQWWL